VLPYKQILVKIPQTGFACCRLWQWWKLSYFLLRRQKTWIVHRNNQNKASRLNCIWCKLVIVIEGNAHPITYLCLKTTIIQPIQFEDKLSLRKEHSIHSNPAVW